MILHQPSCVEDEGCIIPGASKSFLAANAVAAQLWAPQNAYRGLIMVIYKKNLTLCYISRPNDLQKKIS